MSSSGATLDSPAMGTKPMPDTNGSAAPHERRKYLRRQIALDVAYGLAGTGGRPESQHLKRTVTVDLSLGGMCLYTDFLYPVGATLFCVVSLPGRPTPVEMTATVAWFQKASPDSHAYKLGVEFAELAVKDRALLERVVLEEPPPSQVMRGHKLLLVEDDPEFLQALKVRFESAGFQVLTASEGVEALQKSRTEAPNVIILDLMLPKLNGYEVCRLLKFDQKFRHIPIVMCTARARQQDKDLGLSAGADVYVTKPFDGKALLETVETILATPRS